MMTTSRSNQIAEEAWKQITDYADNCEDAICDLAGDTNCIRFIQSAIEKAKGYEYGRGVTDGKLEALKYTPEERESYGKWIAQRAAHASEQP